MTEQYYSKSFGDSNIVTPPNQTLFPTSKPVDCNRGLKLVRALRERHFPQAEKVIEKTCDKLTQKIQLMNQVKGTI